MYFNVTPYFNLKDLLSMNRILHRGTKQGTLNHYMLL